MRTAAAFCAGAILATLAPFAGVLAAAVLHDRNLRGAFLDEIEAA